ncbi:MAG: LysM peptidoglycan-binding domain-containing protein [Flavobacteriaceae bacterium]|nr:LysM peptidoglycan-binding domain-containing protein [Flavobacteriaceae bacterium]
MKLSVLRHPKIIVLAFVLCFSQISWSQQKSFLGFKSHKVEKGENIQDILSQYDLTYEELIEHNSKLKRRLLRHNMRLRIPVYHIGIVKSEDAQSERVLNPNDSVDVSDSPRVQEIYLQDESISEMQTEYGLSFSELLYLQPQIRSEGKHGSINEGLIESYRERFASGLKKVRVYSMRDIDSLLTNSLIPRETLQLNPILEDRPFLNELFSLIEYQEARSIGHLDELDQNESQEEYLEKLNNINNQLQKLTAYQLGQIRLDELYLSGIPLTQFNSPQNYLSLHQKIRYQFLSNVPLDSRKKNTSLKIAVLLPFSVSKYSDNNYIDMIRDLNNDRNLTTISIDFLLGCQLALETASEYGLTANLSVFDTENDSNRVNDLVTTEGLSSFDIIVGPLVAKNFNQLLKHKSLEMIPKYFPVSVNPISIGTQAYRTQPPKDVIRSEIVQYIGSKIDLSDKNVLIVTDPENDVFDRTQLSSVVPSAKTIYPSTGNYLNIRSIEKHMESGKVNIVILDTDSVNLFSNAISVFSAFDNVRSKYEIQLISTRLINTFSYSDLLTEQYKDLDIVFPSLYKPRWGGQISVFEDLYQNQYGKLPSKDAVRGYDLILDIIYTNSLIQNNSSDITQLEPRVYNAYGFDYQESYNQNYFNDVYFLLRYNEGRLWEIVGDFADSIW